MPSQTILLAAIGALLQLVDGKTLLADDPPYPLRTFGCGNNGVVPNCKYGEGLTDPVSIPPGQSAELLKAAKAGTGNPVGGSCDISTSTYTTASGKVFTYLRQGVAPKASDLVGLPDNLWSPVFTSYDVNEADIHIVNRIEGWVDGVGNIQLCQITCYTNLLYSEYFCYC